MVRDDEEVKYFRIQNLDEEPELAAALGNMVIAWSYAEQALMNVMGRVTGLPLNTVLGAYYRIPTINSRMQFLLVLLEQWKMPKFDPTAIEREIIGLAKLSATRNHWIHNEWCRGGPSKEIVQFDQRAKVDSPHRRKVIKATDVSNHNDAVLKRCRKIDQLIDVKNLKIH
jgi:hypothetical protein